MDAALAQVKSGRQVRLIVSTEATPLDALAHRNRACDDWAEFEGSLSDADDAEFLKLAKIGWPRQAYVVLQPIYVEPHPLENLRQVVVAEFRLLFSDDPEVVLGEVRNFSYRRPPGSWSPKWRRVSLSSHADGRVRPL